MLSDYKDIQPIQYNILVNQIKNNKISHAYLFDENNNDYAYSFVMSFVKEILCNNLSNEERTVLCKRIDDGNYPEIKVIEPDGMFIKKQQILDLQNDFSMVAVEGTKRIYIIKDAEKMRSETANSMLKFLEEPQNDIIAILITNNFNNLLSTIISRCQLIRLGTTNENNDKESFDDVIKIIDNIENYGIKTILRENELIFEKYNQKERDKFVILFDKMIDVYYDILKILNGDENISFSEYLNELSKIAKKITKEQVISKINYLVNVKDRVKNNVGINLLFDSVILELGGMYESSRS
jgi:DNA polymerase III delta prime subunit